MKKIILFLIIGLAAILLSSPLVVAVPLQEKNNEKFQTFHVDFKASVRTWIMGDLVCKPSFEQPNYVTKSGPESFLLYDITVGSKTYHQGIDFVYTGVFTYTFFDVAAWGTYVISGATYNWPLEYRERHLVVDYSYDFLPASGIDGSIQLRAVAVGANYGMTINSLSSTGDLQNVQIKATLTSQVGTGLIYTVTHDGYVHGWPV